MILEWTKKKERLENNFSNMILLYCLKWTKKLAHLTLIQYNNDYVYTKFQKKLASVVNWSGEKRDSEFNKFVNWSIKKFNINKDELRRIFINIIVLSIQIILNEELTSKKCSELNFSPQLLDIRELFYTSIKNVTKYYYLNPRKIYETKNDHDISNSIIKKQISNFIPFKNIFNKIQNSPQVSRESKSQSSSDNKFVKEKFLDDTNNDTEYDIEDDVLSYADSLSFSNHEIRLKDYSDVQTDEDNIKHITLPKISNRYLNYKKDKMTNKDIKNINDPDEKFFSD